MSLASLKINKVYNIYIRFIYIVACQAHHALVNLAKGSWGQF